MDHLDMTGIGAAAAALVLALGGWALSPPAAPVQDAAGLHEASQQALEAHAIGQPLRWQDEGGGTVATITPASAYREFDGSWCRTYAVVLAPDGQRATGTRHVACRDGQGRWSQRAPTSKGVQTVSADPVMQLAGAPLR